MKERDFQAHLIKKIRSLLPGCIVLKNDANYLQGFPDLLILFRDRWAVLEVKASANASCQPNQEYYVRYLGEMTFSAFIYPENEEEVIGDLQRALKPRRYARVSQRE